MSLSMVISKISHKIDKYGFITIDKAVDIIYQTSKGKLKQLRDIDSTKLLWKSCMISTLLYYRQDIRYNKQKEILEKLLFKLL